MENKGFKILRYIIIILTCIGIIGIEIYQKKNSNITIDEDPIITKTKEYVNNNGAYFNELFKEKNMEYRVEANFIDKKSDKKGYINIIMKISFIKLRMGL